MMSLPAASRVTPARFEVNRYVLGALCGVMIVAAILLQTPGVQAPMPAVQVATGFRADIDDYVALRHRAEGTTAALRVTSDSTEIFGRERALGMAILAARPGVQQGSIFRGQTVTDFRRIIAADRGRRAPQDLDALAADLAMTVPKANALYPVTLPLATFPPLLLAALPRLPDGLEYRFMGKDLIIRDTNANLIVDYLPEVPAP